MTQDEKVKVKELVSFFSNAKFELTGKDLVKVVRLMEWLLAFAEKEDLKVETPKAEVKMGRPKKAK